MYANHSIWDDSLHGFEYMYGNPWSVSYRYSHPSSPCLQPAKELGLANVTQTNYNYQVVLDCHQFLPEEMVVRTEGNYLSVEGEHVDKEDVHGSISRRFSRRFVMPPNAETQRLDNEYSGGVLTINVPLRSLASAAGEGEGVLHKVGRSISSLFHHATHHSHDGTIIHREEGDLGEGFKKSGVDLTKEHFVVRIEIPNFSAEDISVRTVDDFLIIEGNHPEQKDGHGFISRSFSRKYFLPLNANRDEVRCELTSWGLLTVSVPRVYHQNEEGEKTYPLKVVQ